MASDAQKVTALRMVAADMERDSMALEGAPFDGKTVAEALGHLMAGVAATATILAQHIEERH